MRLKKFGAISWLIGVIVWALRDIWRHPGLTQEKEAAELRLWVFCFTNQNLLRSNAQNTGWGPIQLGDRP
jgi:hypothetical protein